MCVIMIFFLLLYWLKSIIYIQMFDCVCLFLDQVLLQVAYWIQIPWGIVCPHENTDGPLFHISSTVLHPQTWSFDE